MSTAQGSGTLIPDLEWLWHVDLAIDQMTEAEVGIFAKIAWRLLQDKLPADRAGVKLLLCTVREPIGQSHRNP